MEVVMQWLDDIEDLVFALPLAWERLRLWCLRMGLASALILAGLEGFSVLVEWAPPFALAAGTSVCIWALGLLATELAARRNTLAAH